MRERKANDLDQVKCIKDKEDKVLVVEAHARQRWLTYFHELFNEKGDKIIVLDDLDLLRRVVEILGIEG